jgi:hypothetical protein
VRDKISKNLKPIVTIMGFVVLFLIAKKVINEKT